MYHFVPDFDTDVDYVNTNDNNPNSSSSFILPRKSILGEDEDDDLMELLWQKGQVVVQNQRLNNITKKPPSSSSPPKLQPLISTSMQQPQQQQSDQNLFIQEDEMTSWLHYHPLRDDDFCSDLLFEANAAPIPTVTKTVETTQATAAPTPSVTKTVETIQATAAPTPSLTKTVETTQATASRPPVRNFSNFSRLRGDFIGRGIEFARPKAIVRESTQVNPSAATPSSAAAAASESALTRRTDSGVSAYQGKGKAVMESAPGIEIPGTSSSVLSKSEIEPEKTNVDERKRKEREATADETECRSEETKQVRGSSSSSNKRSRAAEVHNLSERKRRDRINERMKALQELIPRCNKSDKASMLDEAIEYMKSLQLQVQMMSMGCGMMPMMYPGMQQYMAMGMGMGMNQPHPPPSFMSFPNMLAAQRPLPTTQTHMGGSGPHYPPPVHASDPSRVFVPNQQFDPTSIPPQYPGYMDPYQQFCSLQPTQPHQFQPQNQATSSSRRVSSNKESEVQGNNTTG